MQVGQLLEDRHLLGRLGQLVDLVDDQQGGEVLGEQILLRGKSRGAAVAGPSGRQDDSPFGEQIDDGQRPLHAAGLAEVDDQHGGVGGLQGVGDPGDGMLR